MRPQCKEVWPWWCCGLAVKKVRRIHRKREKAEWRRRELV